MSEEQRLKELEERVKKLENQLSEMQKADPHKRVDQVKTVQPVQKKEVPKADARQSVEEVPPWEHPKDPMDWERVIGQIWLPRIFIFVLLLGVIWGFKAASEVGIINESVRCILGFVAGVALILVGEIQIRKGRNALGQVLLGGSVTVLVVTTFATHVLYGFIGLSAAFSMNLIWIVLGIYFAIRHRSEVLAVLATVGGYFIPFLLDSNTANTWFFVSYVTIFSIIMLGFALWKKYSKLHVVAMVLLPVVLMLYMVFAILPIYPVAKGDLGILSYGMFLQHLALLGVFLTYKVYPKVQQSVLLISFLASLGFMYQGFDRSNWPIILLGIAIVYFIVYVYVHFKKITNTSTVIFPILLLSMLFYFMEVFTGRELAIILLLQGTAAIYIGLINKIKLQLWSGAFVYIIGLLHTITVQIEEINSAPMYSWTVLIATLWFLTYLAKKDIEIIPNESRRLLFGTTAVALLAYISQLSYVFTKYESVNTQYLTMTLCWIVYAVCGIVYGVVRNNQAVRIVGIILLFLSLGKLIFIDLPNVSIVVRATLFMIVGATGVVVSRFFYTKDKSESV
ncbi:DUF2339 domain-containing protein [Alkalihalobacillus sp. TS-13]|uniref:DUF2339 domain-containing protein n=1 Tax=Alkalihalobacillus sp. TS-13 TaxID=2842455 RepID=UPI001C87B024|nr:DUF2339 domain-containing protein [Alkalihalobacillus sp. TS-13]